MALSTTCQTDRPTPRASGTCQTDRLTPRASGTLHSTKLVLVTHRNTTLLLTIPGNLAAMTRPITQQQVQMKINPSTAATHPITALHVYTEPLNCRVLLFNLECKGVCQHNAENLKVNISL